MKSAQKGYHGKRLNLLRSLVVQGFIQQPLGFNGSVFTLQEGELDLMWEIKNLGRNGRALELTETYKEEFNWYK
jgi:hypothetical protein